MEKRKQLYRAGKACLLLMALAGVAACASDEGNYNYKETNTLSIAQVEKDYTIEQFETLTINPTITGTQGFEEGDYDYVWYLYRTNSTMVPDTLSREKNLHAELHTTPGDYELMYFVTDKKSGVFASARSEVLVVNSFSKGVAVLSQVGDEANLTFINTLGRVTENAYQAVNGHTAGKNPKSLFFVGDDDRGTTQTMVLVVTDSGTEALSPTDLRHMMDFNDMFYFPGESGIVQAQAYTSYHYNEKIIMDGYFYTRSLTSFGEEKPFPKFEVRMKGTYSLAPFIFTSKNNEYVYDNLTRSFKVAYHGIKELESVADNSYFDPKDMQADMIWGHDFEINDEGAIRAVMQDDNGKRFIISGTKQKETDRETWNTYYRLIPTARVELNHEGGATSSCYAISADEPNFLYYAQGNRITCISCITGNVLATYEANGHIDCMEFNYDNDIARLYVGVSDGSRTAQSGSIYFLQQQADGSLTEEARFEHVCGQVIDFQYKE